MSSQVIIKELKEKFGQDILKVFEHTSKRVYVDIDPGALLKVAGHVFKNMGARFNIASGTDARTHMEILYHFTFDTMNVVVSFRVRLEKTGLSIDSLANLFEGANWIEREMNELLGIEFRGHPDMRRLLLPDEWPEGVYPLRRDYKEWDKNAIRDRGI